MKHKRFALCINYQDTNIQIKHEFDLKCDAITDFRHIKEVIGFRPVVITLYDGLSPCWVYHSQFVLGLSNAYKRLKDGDVYFMAILPLPKTNEYNVRFFDSENKYQFEVHHLTQKDVRTIYKECPNVYNYYEEMPF